MRNIYVVGTVHGGVVPEKEMVEVLESIKPDQLFLELPDKSLEEILASEDNRDEMMSAYRWADANNVSVCCFDSNASTFRDGISPKSPEFKKLFADQLEVIEATKISWKEHNEKKHDSLLDHPLIDVVSNPEKELAREKDMLETILSKSIQEGTILVLTGAGHLPFFEKELSEAIFPLRK